MIDSNAKIRILKKPDVTDLAGEKVMIDFESGKYFMLVGSANDIWDILKDDITIGEIVDALLDIYEVEPEICKQSAVSFLEKLVEIKFIELVYA